MTGRVMAVSLFSVSSRPQSLPSSIQDVKKKAKLVQDIDTTIAPHFASSTFKGQIFALSQSSFDAMLKDVTKVADEQIYDLDNTNARSGVAFSLWSGCISAAKEIATGTRGGANTPESRMDTFENLINPLCEIDELFKAGAETAPILKRLRKEDISFSGVPAGSPVLVYKDTSN